MKYKFISCLLLGLFLISASIKFNGIESKSKVFQYLITVLDENFVDEVNEEELMNTAMRAALSSLDPYSKFYDEEETKSHFQSMDGILREGIGVFMFYRDGYTVVSSINPGSPAEKNDIRVGDIILEIDGKVIWEQYVKDVQAMLEGEPGSMVKLKMNRPTKGAYEVNIKRKNILRAIVPYSTMLNDTIAYVKLNHFWGQSADSLKTAIQKLQKKKGKKNEIKGLVLDLQNNNGGSAFQAVEIANFFLPKGKPIYYMKSRSKDFEPYKTLNEPLYPDMKLALLINDYSSSAAELLSGALQDYDRAVIVGQNSYGKGLVQQTWNLGDSTSMYFTLSRYHTPLKRCIQKMDYSKVHLGQKEQEYQDWQKSEYFTANKRKFRDYEGIVPDVVLPKKETADVVSAINRSYPFFDYVNYFRNTHESIAGPTNFIIEDQYFEVFIEFIKESNYNFTLKTESEFLEWEKKLKENNSEANFTKEVNATKNAFKALKLQQLFDNKNEVKKSLEYHIVSRYYNVAGEYEYLLRNSKEAIAAKSVLSKPKEYFKLLGNSQFH